MTYHAFKWFNDWKMLPFYGDVCIKYAIAPTAATSSNERNPKLRSCWMEKQKRKQKWINEWMSCLLDVLPKEYPGEVLSAFATATEKMYVFHGYISWCLIFGCISISHKSSSLMQRGGGALISTNISMRVFTYYNRSVRSLFYTAHCCRHVGRMNHTHRSVAVQYCLGVSCQNSFNTFYTCMFAFMSVTVPWHCCTNTVCFYVYNSNIDIMKKSAANEEEKTQRIELKNETEAIFPSPMKLGHMSYLCWFSSMTWALCDW